MALTILAERWARKLPHIKLTAFTVDHGMREESTAEACAVQSWCRNALGATACLWSRHMPAAVSTAVFGTVVTVFRYLSGVDHEILTLELNKHTQEAARNER